MQRCTNGELSRARLKGKGIDARHTNELEINPECERRIHRHRPNIMHHILYMFIYTPTRRRI